MNDAKVYAPFRCVAAFADGSRLLFDGLTREQARSTMEAAMEQHGDISWWNWVTDENYRNGEYYKLIPPPPLLPFPILDLSDCKTEEERQKALQDPFEEDGEPRNPLKTRKALQRPRKRLPEGFPLPIRKLFFRWLFLCVEIAAFSHRKFFKLFSFKAPD